MIKLLIFALVSSIEADYDSTFHAVLNEVMNYTFREMYDNAKVLSDSLIALRPNDPLPHLILAGLYDYYMLDYSTDELDDAFKMEIETVFELTERYKESDPSKYHYFRGLAYAYRATRAGRKRSLISAFKDGLRARKELRKAIELDSTLYDAYLPLGIFDYALSEAPKFIRWLMGSEDRREQGINEVRLAAEKGWITKVPAKHALVWMLAYYGRTREAVKIARELVQEYPTSRSFRWALAYALRRLGRWKEAKRVYEELFYLTANDSKQSLYNIALTLYWLAKSCYMTRDWDEAYYYSNAALLALDKCEKDSPGLKIMRRNLRRWIKVTEKRRSPIDTEQEDRLPMTFRELR